MTGTHETSAAPSCQEAQAALSGKFETVGRLAAGIAHEINSPMQYINSNIGFLLSAFTDLLGLQQKYRELLSRVRAGEPVSEDDWRSIEDEEKKANPSWLESEIPAAIRQSLEGVDHVSKIALAIKDFSHPAFHDQILSDINRGIQNIATISRHEWKYVADMDLRLDPDLPLTLCALDEINQAILNIILNAAHAVRDKVTTGGYERGRIGISTSLAGDEIAICVSDDGPGIPTEILPRIFEPFFTTKPAGKGTGQGLAIARDIIVNRHGGRLDVVSEPGRGTSFTITLRRHRDESKTDASERNGR